MSAPSNDQRSRDLLVRLLLEGSHTTPHNLFSLAAARADRDGWRFEWRAALEYWGDFARAGIIATLGGQTDARASAPGFVLTERGRKLLTEERASPHDGTRYMLVLRERVPNVDPIALTYIEEAIGNWLSGHYRSAAVMTGGACERLIILIGEAVAASTIEPVATELAKAFASDKPVGIAWLFERVRNALIAAKQTKAVQGDVVDGIDRKLTPIFERARVLRNDVGHPTGEIVSAEEAEAGLLLFPSFCEYASTWSASLPRTR